MTTTDQTTTAREIGARIRAVAGRAHLTPQDIAHQTGVAFHRAHAIWHGEVEARVDELVGIADLLHTPVGALIDGGGTRPGVPAHVVAATVATLERHFPWLEGCAATHTACITVHDCVTDVLGIAFRPLLLEAEQSDAHVEKQAAEWRAESRDWQSAVDALLALRPDDTDIRGILAAWTR